MRRKINIWKNIDWITVLSYLVLVFLGWLNIYAAVYNEEYNSIFDFSQRYGKQLIWIFAALSIAFIVLIIDINFYTYFAYFIYGFLIFVLILVLIFGKEVHGAKSWIEISNIRIQPAEFAKISTALLLARFLSTFNIQLNDFKTILKLGFFILLPAFLILMQNDTGSALVFFAFVFVLYREGISEILLLFGGFIIVLFILSLLIPKIFLILGSILLALIVFYFINRRTKNLFIGLFIIISLLGVSFGANHFLQMNIPDYYLIFGSLSIASLIYLALAYRYKIKNVGTLLIFLFCAIIFSYSVDFVFNNFLEPHQQKRINTLLGIESDPLGIGYNVNQSKIAIGSGGLTGKGFLNGTQTKFDFVPEQSTDFIFCTIGEEWGFIGTFFIVAFFIFFLLRLIKLAERQRSSFSRIYGYGVVSVLMFHIFINIGMTIGIMPVIGIPLPFFSYGGSSLWAFTILVFILIRLDASRLELLR